MFVRPLHLQELSRTILRKVQLLLRRVPFLIRDAHDNSLNVLNHIHICIDQNQDNLHHAFSQYYQKTFLGKSFVVEFQ